MPEVLIRPAVTPDIEAISKLNHSIDTIKVWQMSQSNDAGQVSTMFNEVQLPRAMRIHYPQSPDMMLERWKDYSAVMVGCISGIPVGYISLVTLFIPDMIWIKDLVVDEPWRRQGIGFSLMRAASDWGVLRKYIRMTLECSSKNFPAICLAKKAGFEFSGFDDNYFRNNDIALFFSRNLK
jgi:GNAT superfamily N-acetyltransferase